MAERKIKKRADGRYMRRVKIGTDPITGKPIRPPVYGYTLAEVNAAARELRDQRARGEILVNKSTLIGDYADVWLAANISPNRKKSYAQYKAIIEKHIKPRFRYIKISEVKTSQIQTEITAIESEGKIRTAIIFRMTMIQIMNSALNDDLCFRNYAAQTKKPSYEATEKKPLSEHEIDLVESADLEPQERLFVYLCLFQGLRKGEALGLRRVSGDKLEITQVWQCGSENKPSIKSQTKTSSGYREMNIMPQVKTALDAVQTSHKNLYLFSNEDGRLITGEQYKGLWRRIQTAINIAAGGVSPMGRRKSIQVAREFSSHYLRHTFCTMLYYADFDLKQTQYLMGQSDIKTTLDTYTHLDKMSLGKKDKYAKWKPILREIFLNEKESKRSQKGNL